MKNHTLFRQWMTEHEKLLRHLIIGFEANAALQDELFQDIALNIWRALPGFRQDASVKTFVARIAHNVLATHVAKTVRTVKTEPNSDDDRHEHLSGHVSEQVTPYQALDKNQRQQRLLHCIRQLKLNQQQVITLALEGMTYQEISDVLMITINLVGVRLQRAKAALTTLLEAG